MSEAKEEGEAVLENGVLGVDSFSKGTGAEVSVISASELTNADMTSDMVLEESALGFREDGADALQENFRSIDQPIHQATEIGPEETVPNPPISVEKPADEESLGEGIESESECVKTSTKEMDYDHCNNDEHQNNGDKSQSDFSTDTEEKTRVPPGEERKTQAEPIEEAQVEPNGVLENEASEDTELNEVGKLSEGRLELAGEDRVSVVPGNGDVVDDTSLPLEQHSSYQSTMSAGSAVSSSSPEGEEPKNSESQSPKQDGKEKLESEDKKSELGGSQKLESGGSQKSELGGSQKSESEGSQKSESGGSQKSESGDIQKSESGGIQKSESGGIQKSESGGIQKSESEGSQKSNSQSEWVDILGSGELQKKVLQPGKGLSTRPTHQSRVKLRVRGILHGEDGADKSVDRHSAVSFTVGDGDVIQAWDIAVTLMELGEVARVKTSARFAYGTVGKPPSIPGNASLTYELELLEVNPPLLLIDITEQELTDLVEVKKTRGNELYKREEYHKALNSYHKGLQAVQSYLDCHKLTPADAPPVIAELLIRCQNNIAATQLKVENYKESLSACESVLKLDADNVKALYRAGRVLGHLGEWRDAVTRLERAAELDPDNKVIQTELQKTLRRKESADKKEKEMYRRMVGGKSKEKETRAKSASSSDSSWGPWPYFTISGIAAVLAIGAAYFVTQRP